MVRKIPISKFNLFLIVFSLVLIYFLSAAVPKETLQGTLEGLGILGPLVLGLILLVTYILAPLNGTPFLLVGFYLYGSNIVFFSSIAAWVSSIINFWISRRWGRPLVEKMVGIKDINRIDKLTINYGFLAIFFLRVLTGALQDFVSYAAGLTPMKFSRYLLASTLGMIPGTFLWYRLTLKANSPLQFVLLTFVLISIFAAIFFLSQKISKKLQK